MFQRCVETTFNYSQIEGMTKTTHLEWKWNSQIETNLKHFCSNIYSQRKKHMGILFDCRQLMSILRNVHVEMFFEVFKWLITTKPEKNTWDTPSSKINIPSSKLTWQWKIPIVNREYIFNTGPFSITMLVYRRVTPDK